MKKHVTLSLIALAMAGQANANESALSEGVYTMTASCSNPTPSESCEKYIRKSQIVVLDSGTPRGLFISVSDARLGIAFYTLTPRAFDGREMIGSSVAEAKDAEFRFILSSSTSFEGVIYDYERGFDLTLRAELHAAVGTQVASPSPYSINDLVGTYQGNPEDRGGILTIRRRIITSENSLVATWVGDHGVAVSFSNISFDPQTSQLTLLNFEAPRLLKWSLGVAKTDRGMELVGNAFSLTGGQGRKLNFVR